MMSELGSPNYLAKSTILIVRVVLGDFLHYVILYVLDNIYLLNIHCISCLALFLALHGHFENLKSLGRKWHH